MLNRRMKHDCRHCDEPGGEKTNRNQASMRINCRFQCIDRCIHRIVTALTAGGFFTVASCYGHRAQTERIDLEDGRVLVIFDNESQLV